MSSVAVGYSPLALAANPVVITIESVRIRTNNAGPSVWDVFAVKIQWRLMPAIRPS
jgi:hypothetical protein